MTRSSFFTVEQIGPKQSLTPEGFLLCEEVPIARTGMMIYGPDETPIEAGPDGIVKIYREDDDVFRPETIASALGKPVTDDHPDDDVTPATWKERTEGFALNIRRGIGAYDDLLFADLMITTPDGIKAVQGGKREVSMGYDADYEEVSVGVGRQRNIIINHIALVEQGRCGPRCAIRDQKLITTEVPMAVKKNTKWVDKLMLAFKAKDAAEVEKLAAEMQDEGLGETGENGEVHIHINTNGEGTTTAGAMQDEGDPAGEQGRASFTDDQIQEHIEQNAAEHAELRSRIEALEAALAGTGTGDEGEPAENKELATELRDEAPEGLGEEATKAKDSAYLVDSFKDTVSAAEILVPGISIPTADRAAKPGVTFKKLCNFRRSALDLAYAQPATRNILDELLSGKSLDTKAMTCDAVRTLFKSAVAVRKNVNNSGHRASGVQDTSKTAQGVSTLAELNKRNAQAWNH